MQWKEAIPAVSKAKPNFFWAYTANSVITILKRSSKKGIWSFGGDAVEAKAILYWGDRVEVPEDCWTPNEPTVEGWFAAMYDDQSFGVIRVAFGEKPHCYDFEIPAEIDIKKVVAWNGPIDLPRPPEKK